jgi:hypothetical protein
MMGKNMALRDVSAAFPRRACEPEGEEQYHHNGGQNSDGPPVCLLVHFDKAIEEGAEPKEPLQEGSQHDEANHGHVYDLGWSTRHLDSGMALTSLTGHGSVIEGRPPGPNSLATIELILKNARIEL